MSFGSSGFGGFGASSNNNQTNNAFGGFGSNNTTTTTAGTGFGGFGSTSNNTSGGLFGSSNTATNTGFGGSSGFGANNNNAATGFGQSRPSAFGTPAPATGGGIFGNSANNTTSTGFGGFGNNQTQNTSSPFGATPTNTGGGIFGQNNATTGTGFGSTSNTSSPFGATNTSSGFGSGGGFGTPAPTSAFGASANTPQQNNGTGGAPFQPFTDKDGAGGQQQQYMSITCQDAYRNASFEELRQQDYLQGRKHGNANGQGGAFGTNTGFGGFGANTNTAANTSSPFGSNNTTNAFGAQPTTPAFGAATSTPTAGFGSSGGIFGQNKPAGGGLFGSNTTATSSQPSGGLFGTSNTTNTGFGGSASSGGGLFGAKPAGTGFGGSTTTGFGANNNQPATGGGLFGANANNTSTPNLFGNTQQQSTASPFGSGFGQSQPAQNQAQQSSGGGLFGNSAFGANNNNQAKPGGLFGATPNTNTGGGLFGANNNQQQQPAAGGGLFGGLNNNNNQQNQNTGGGLFGAPKPATSNNLFGSSQPANNAGGGLFGGNQNNNAGGGLFGGTQNNTTSGGLFGSTSNQQKPGGLFGSSLGQTTNNTNTGGLFGSTNQSTTNNNNNNSLFGGNTLVGSQQQQQSPQALTASIMSSTPYGNTELFASLATPQHAVGPLATPLSSSQKQRKPAPLAQWKINPAASSRLITPQKRVGGYGFSYSTYGTPGSAYGSPSLYGGLLSGGNSSRLNKSLSTSNLRSTYNGGETVLNPDAFSPSPRSYRAGGSLKKLHINRNLRSDLFGGEDASLKSSPLKKAVTFDPNQSQGSDGSPTNEESSTALTRIEQGASATPSAEDLGFIRSPRKANGSGSGPSVPDVNVEPVRGNELAVVHENESDADKAAPEQQRPLPLFPDQSDKVPGEYWMKPTKAEIAKLSRQQRKSVKGFTVGRENTGQIQFSEVNLDGVDLDRVIGTDVTIQTREAVVYPNELTKQPPGKGFNVPSLITLYNAWPRARAGAIPVYERKGKRYEKHIERLQKVTNTDFVDYDPSNGAWTFRVDHFSSYQVPDYDDDEPSALESSLLSAPPDTPTPQSGSSRHPSSQRSQFLQDASMVSRDSFMQESNVEDTFEFRQSSRLPGAFDDDGFGYRLGDANGFNNSNLISGEYTADLTAPEMRMSGGLGSTQGVENGNLDDYSSVMDSSMVIDAPKHSPNFATSMKPTKSILKANQQLPYFGGTPSRVADEGAGDWADQLQRTLSPKKRDRNILRESLGAGASRNGRLSGSLTKESNPFATSIDVMKSLFGGDENRSKQGSEGKGFQWPYPKRSKLDVDTVQTPQDDFQQLFRPSWADDVQFQNVRKDLLKASKARQAPEMIETQRQLTTFSIVNAVPQAVMIDSFAFSRLATAAEAQVKAATSPELVRFFKEEQIMWHIASILFDEVEGHPEQVAIVRKEKLAAFWVKLVESAAMTQAAEAKSAEEHAFALLSCRNVVAASMVLSDARDHLLAMSIAQIGADETMRIGMAEQINHWRDNNSLSEIPSRVRVLYELLAGNTTISEGKTGAGPENKANDIFISQDYGLDWRQSFGLKLWYGSPTAEPLTKTVLEHHGDLIAGDEKVEPVPWFIRDNVPTGWSNSTADGDGRDQHDGQDILWSLLKIYVALKDPAPSHGFYDSVWDGFGDMIKAGNVTGNPANARLTFQLYQTLGARNVIDYDEPVRDAKADQHAIDYAFELASSASDLVDAVFVTLHILEPATREKAVKLLLNRHADAIGDDSASSVCYRRLTDDFLLPDSWLWAAKASYAKTVLHDDVAEMRCLLRAGQPKEAHDTLRKRVGPMAVIEEDLDALKAILADFEAFGLAKSAEWPAGGGLYQDYIALLGMPRASESVKGERLRLATRLRGALPLVDAPGLSLEERAAVSEMAAVVAKMLKEMNAGEAKSTKGSAVVVAPREDRVLAATSRQFANFYAQVLVK